MQAYLDIVRKILSDGVTRSNRTGVDAITIPGAIFEHDMATGFPLLTTKSVPFRLIATELEFFIRGITDKQWLQDRNNHIWDEWCNPSIVPYGHDEDTKLRMFLERDLGPIYGWQWRHFGAKYVGYDKPHAGVGIDQLGNLVRKLDTDPSDRRMIVSAWNPADFHLMALPPCHYSFQVTVIGNKLNLGWNQRSVDVALGLPFNIASYGLLLLLLARQFGLEAGKLFGFLADTHVYVNHVDGLRTQLSRDPRPLPEVDIAFDASCERWQKLFKWECGDACLRDYYPAPKIKFDIAV